MSKIFRVEEGNVLRVVMDEPIFFNYTNHHEYGLDFAKWENRESYPYVADWKVGETKIQGIDFVIVRQDGIQVATLRLTEE